MKKKLTLTVSIVAFAIAISVVLFFVLNNYIDAKSTTTYVTSTDPKEDIEVGKLTLNIIDETVNISSNTYTYDFPFKLGGLDDDAGVGKSIAYFFTGKRIELVGYVDFNMTSDLAIVKEDDIAYDKETKVLTVYLPEPKMDVTYNTKTGLKKGDAKYEGIASGGYNEEEMLRLPELIVVYGAKEIEKEKPKDIEDAKDDIKNGLTNLLTNIETVKADENDSKEAKDSKDKKKESVEELSKVVKRVDVRFKDE